MSNLSDFYLLCLLVGGLWSVITILGAGFGGSHHFLHHGRLHLPGASRHVGSAHHLLSGLMNPSSLAVFLAWFGGAGYLLNRHTGWLLWVEIFLAALLGLVGAVLFAIFFRWLQSREQPLDPADYRLPGVLGRVSCTIRPDGVGEMIYLRNGARTPLPARSDAGSLIPRGEEVVVTRYERGIAYVRSFRDDLAR